MVGAFNPFTFKLITSLYVIITILLIVLFVFVGLFFFCFFCSFLLWFDDYLLYCIWIAFPFFACIYLLWKFGLPLPWGFDIAIFPSPSFSLSILYQFRISLCLCNYISVSISRCILYTYTKIYKILHYLGTYHILQLIIIIWKKI